NGGDWPAYERQFNELLKRRQVEVKVAKDLIADGCLLCSEDKPEHCHRRLVAEYFEDHWGDVDITHLA
ncbi:MAG TPA: DUF488 family protein, partial [Candidatus Aminicenantes bacterium]|nr:DUF488 family protein [Candidatus Aminicenantes bacterium]